MTINMPIGELLVHTKVITKEQLDQAIEKQKEQKKNVPIGELLQQMGFVSEKQLMKALEFKFKVPFVELSGIEIDEEVLATVSDEDAKKYGVVPLALSDGRLTIATSDPMNFQAFDDIKFKTGFEVISVLATKTDITSVISKYYEQTKTNEEVQDLTSELSDLEMEELTSESNANVDSAPIVRMVNLIIVQAINERASDIHIEPLENEVRVRSRVDGVLNEQMRLPKASHSAIVTRIKILGNMDIAERRIPQDGRTQVNINGKTIDLRLSILPTVTGEKIVIRILGGGTMLTRAQLGFTAGNSLLFDSILKSPNGLILVSGPTGSGKSTTLYTVLGEVNKPGVNVITVEDPVEFKMDGVAQVQVNNKAGMTFASGLRSILRQDPDVILVGEIRDSETADIAVRAAITGHLVLSTIHTNDSASTINRLIDMGVKSYLVSTSLVGVVAQRLVRRICPKCKQSRIVDLAERKFLDLPEEGEDVRIYYGAGCENCKNTGYRGRIAIHEILVMTRDLRAAIDRDAPVDELRKIGAQNGTRTLRQSCADLVLEGTTTIDELLKVAYSVDL